MWVTETWLGSLAGGFIGLAQWWCASSLFHGHMPAPVGAMFVILSSGCAGGFGFYTRRDAKHIVRAAPD